MLKGKKVKLRPMEMEDVSKLNKLKATGDTLYNLSTGIPVPSALVSEEVYFGEKLRKWKSMEPDFVVTTLDDTIIGMTGIVRNDPYNSNALVHIFMGEEYTGRGYGTEAMELLLNFIFLEMNMERVHLKVFSFNERAIKSYLKAGFKEEGRMREHLYRNGNYYDMVEMAILRQEFLDQARKEGRI